TDEQELSLTTNVLSITGGINTIDLSIYLDNTDAQNLSLVGTSLSIDNGNSVDLSVLQDGYEANTDNQELSNVANVLSITGGTNTVDLSTYLDNTDAQNISLIGTSLSIENGNAVDLSTLQDGYEANTDEQTLQLSGTELSISGGNAIELSSLQDGYEANTDSQELSNVANVLSITGGTNTVDLSGYLDNTDAQNLALTGTSLTIDNGNSVDLSILQDGYEANTDEQTLQLEGTELSISGGNKVDLGSLSGVDTDDQTLALSGTTLSIQDGNSVDLSSLLTSINASIETLNAQVKAQADKIATMEADIALLKSYHDELSLDMTAFPGSKLFDCVPNPSNGNIRIDYYLTPGIKSANLLIYDLNGRLYKNIPVKQVGDGTLELSKGELNAGTYYYTLVAEGYKVGTKKMVIVF
ncbi:MAG: T9SS type A sorting domain-containing protein, partial [Bacteroidales bacterium]|nr:T9SS type A sorting domain-containing protein [Bacteroidales bacterium]